MLPVFSVWKIDVRGMIVDIQKGFQLMYSVTRNDLFHLQFLPPSCRDVMRIKMLILNP